MKASKEDYKLLLNEILTEFPDFKMHDKNGSMFMKVIDIALRVITLNRMKTFMSHFVTTIGSKVFVPENWSKRSRSSKLITLRHERVHMQQVKKHGRFLFSFLYLLVLPAVWTYRAKFEKEAYEESIRAIAEVRGPDALANASRERIVRHFVSAEYFWMQPDRDAVEEWYDASVARVRDEHGYLIEE